MGYTQETIFSKIGELLLEINDTYEELSEKGVDDHTGQLVLLEAKADFLTAHIRVLARLADANSSSQAVVSENSGIIREENNPLQKVENDFFTPPIALDNTSDKQPVEPEIHEEKNTDDTSEAESEKAQSSDSLSEGEPLAEEQKESATDNSSPNTEEEKSVQNDAVRPIAEEDEDLSDIGSMEPKQKLFGQTNEPSKEEQSEAVVSSAREETELEPDATTDSKPVVVQVIEESREVVIEQPQANEENRNARPMTINEILQQQRKGAASPEATNTSNPGVSGINKSVDLKTVINLNDKLLFIKDLFNGYTLAYSEAVELLNRYNSFAEADAFLQTNYALKNNWADKPQTVEKLYVVLRKKFL